MKATKEVAIKRRAFLHKWRLKCPAVADSLEEAGDRLFIFLHFPDQQWRSIRTSNAIERRHEEFKRRIKTQCLLPCAETACLLFWALLASSQIIMRKVDGWQTLHVTPADLPLDLAAWPANLTTGGAASTFLYYLADVTLPESHRINARSFRSTTSCRPYSSSSADGLRLSALC